MTEDYQYLSRRRDEISSRRAAQRPDEEPDFDAMSSYERHTFFVEDERDAKSEAYTRADRGW